MNKGKVMELKKHAISLFSVSCSLIIAMTASTFAQVSADSLIRVTAVRDAYPYWSPDGKQIVFQSDRNSSMLGNSQVYILNADGSNVTTVLDNHELVEDARPVWSPDGSKILFNRQYIANESSMDILIIRLPEELAVSSFDK